MHGAGQVAGLVLIPQPLFGASDQEHLVSVQPERFRRGRLSPATTACSRRTVPCRRHPASSCSPAVSPDKASIAPDSRSDDPAVPQLRPPPFRAPRPPCRPTRQPRPGSARSTLRCGLGNPGGLPPGTTAAGKSPTRPMRGAVVSRHRSLMKPGPTTSLTDRPVTASRRRVLARTRLDFWLDALLLAGLHARLQPGLHRDRHPRVARHRTRRGPAGPPHAALGLGGPHHREATAP